MLTPALPCSCAAAQVLCLGVAVGNVNMAEKELYVNIQARALRMLPPAALA